MNQSEFIQAVRKSIANGETELAFDLFREQISNYDDTLLSDITMLESRYKTAQSDFLIKGILPREDFDRTTAQINYAILEILEKIEKSTYSNKGGAKDKSSGRILHNIPGTMPLGKETRCIVRIAYDDETLTRNFKVTADTVVESVKISEVMGVELVDFNETPAFQIRTITEEEQFLACDDFTQWIFQVKPILEGTYPLTLKVTVIETIDDKERRRDIVLEKEIYIINQPVAQPQAAPSTASAVPPPAPAPVVTTRATDNNAAYKIGFEETNIRLNYVVSNEQAAAVEVPQRRVSTSVVSAIATVIFAITGFFYLQNNNMSKEVDKPSPSNGGGSTANSETKNKNQNKEIENKEDTLEFKVQAIETEPNNKVEIAQDTKDNNKKEQPKIKKSPVKVDSRIVEAPKYANKSKRPAINAVPPAPVRTDTNSTLPESANAGLPADPSSVENGKTDENNQLPIAEYKTYRVRISVKDDMKKATILVNGEPPLSIEKNKSGVPEFIQFKSNKPVQTFSFVTKKLTCKVDNVAITDENVVIESCSFTKQ